MLSVQLEETDINPDTGVYEVSVVLDMHNNNSYIINEHTGKVAPNRSIVYGYQGENKFRTTAEISTRKDDHSHCFYLKYHQFKHLVAIDTNSFDCQVAGKLTKISLGIAVTLVDEKDAIIIQPLRKIFYLINSGRPENENWEKLIRLVSENCKCSDSRKIGVVVDSDLGNLHWYNQRKMPIFKDYFLPENIELIFASDKVSDSIFNRMIKESHGLSKAYIPKFIEYIRENESRFCA